MPQWQPAINTGSELTHHPRTQHQTMRYNLGLGRVYFAKYEGNPDEISNNLSHQKGDFWIDGSTINNRIDRSFFDPKYSVIEKQLYGIEVKEIRELADVMRGKYVKKDKLHNKGEYLILSGKNIKEGKLILTPRDKFIDQIPKNFEKVMLDLW